MSLSRLNVLSSYASTAGTTQYTFDIGVDLLGGVTVKNIRGPNGLMQDSYTSLPSSVVDDIAIAKAQVVDLLSETSITTGSASFTAQTTVAVVFLTPLDNANYRVTLATTPSGPVGTATNLTTVGFTIVLAATYTGSVDWVVLQKASSTSMLSGTKTFTSASPSQTVTFLTSLASTDDRVILTPVGCYPVAVSSKTTTGFIIQMGIALTNPATATVGFDVFT